MKINEKDLMLSTTTKSAKMLTIYDKCKKKPKQPQDHN